MGEQPQWGPPQQWGGGATPSPGQPPVPPAGQPPVQPQQPPAPPQWGGQQWGAPPSWGGQSAGRPPGGSPQDGPPQGGWQGGWQGGPWSVRPKPGIVPLRPLGLGEIYDGAFQAIRTNPRTMIGFSAVVVAVATVLTTLPQAAALSSVVDAGALDDPDASLEDVAGSVAGLFSGLLLPAVVTTLAVTVLSGMLIVAVSNAVLGRRTTPGALWQRTRGRVLPLIGVSILVPLLLGLVVAALVLPGIGLVLSGADGLGAAVVVVGILVAVVAVVYLYTRWAMAPPALMLEGQGVFASLRRSAAVVKGSFWRTFGILLLTGIIVSIVSGLITVPFAIVSGIVAAVLGGEQVYSSFWVTLLQLGISGLGTIVAGAVLYPFQAGVTALLYVDLRMRTEGLDLELIRASEGSAA